MRHHAARGAPPKNGPPEPPVYSGPMPAPPSADAHNARQEEIERRRAEFAGRARFLCRLCEAVWAEPTRHRCPRCSLRGRVSVVLREPLSTPTAMVALRALLAALPGSCPVCRYGSGLGHHEGMACGRALAAAKGAT